MFCLCVLLVWLTQPLNGCEGEATNLNFSKVGCPPEFNIQ